MPSNLTIIAGGLLGAVLAGVGVRESQVHPAPEPVGGETVLKSESALVVLDVVVTDKKGQPIHGLKAADFTVLEKDQEMRLQSFAEHRTDQIPPPTPLPAKPTIGPNIFTNITDAPSDGPLNIVLLDALNTPIADQMYAREQMLEYVKKVPQGTRIAIFGLSNRLYMLQGFTADPAVLQANVQRFRAEKIAVPPALRRPYTLAAIEDLVRYLSGLPGRKNLIWFAGSFPRVIPDGDQEFAVMATFADDMKWTANLLMRSQVAVYPVDARGLFSNPQFSAAVGPPPGPNSVSNFLSNRAHGKIGMNVLAEETGGKAFYDTNGLKEAVEESINDGFNYYTLAYVPTDRRWDGRYRGVRVKLDQSGVELFYRKGYFAYDPDAPRAKGGQALPMSVMDSAMLLGGRNPTQIPFMVKIVPTAGTENTLPPTNQPNVKKMKPPYRHYTVWYGANLRSLTFTVTPDGTHHGSLEFAALLYSPDGELMNATREMMKVDLPAARYEMTRGSGLEFRQNIDAPAKSEYFLRIGVRDVGSDRVGAVEVPLAAIPPAPPAAGGS